MLLLNWVGLVKCFRALGFDHRPENIVSVGGIILLKIDQSDERKIN